MTSVWPPVGTIAVNQPFLSSRPPNTRFLGLAILSGEVSLGHPVVCSRFHEDIFLLLPIGETFLADGYEQTSKR